MGWIETLSRTYDVCSDFVGKKITDEAVLLPIAHSTANAQVEITVDMNGNIIPQLTWKVKKNGSEEITIIPVTEDSAARGNGNFPHPLCDKLCYVAEDFGQYTGEDKRDYFENYRNGLKKWVDSSYSHPYLMAVYKYIQKGTVIEDLVTRGILQTDENGMLLEKDNKIHNLAQKDAFVRFAVEQDGIKINLWNCQELFDVYIQYVLHGFETKQMCYVSGREEACAEKHPAKIRNSADKAKLISGNDDTGFTYRGRFESRGEAVAVSYVTSQKAHNALRWLLQKQGYLRDGSAIVTWKLPENDAIEHMSEEMIQTPDIMENTVNAFSFDWEDEDTDSDDTAPDEQLPDIGTRYAILLNRAMDGYAKDFTKEDRVIMIALDAATTGRLSINFYHEFEGNQFIQNVIAWHREASWKRWVLFRKTGKYVLMENAPSPREIVLAAYGTERTKGYLDCEPKLLKNAVQRILPCIVGIHKNIPKDILRAMVARASNPQAYSLFVWENQVFAVACAMLNYRNKKIKKEGEQIMDAEMEKAILFGKLLAILDESERKATYDPEQKSSDKRLTNAKKLWNAYTRRPKTTFERLHSKVIQAYSRNLSGGTRQYMEDETMKLVNRLNELERFDNRPLKEEYLLGYYEQKEEIKNFKGKDGGKNNG